MGRRRTGCVSLALVVAGAVAACDGDPVAAPAAQSPTPVSTVASTATPTPLPSSASPIPAPPGGATPAPAWLGTRVLPTGSAGFGIAGTTPPELVDRRIVTADELPPPADGAFRGTVQPVPAAVVTRSTWSRQCPVDLADLRYLTVTFRGFDGRPHTGELLAHRRVAADLVTVFRRLYAAAYPIERMRIITRSEREAPPTGDGNTTTAFVCRPTVGARHWSQHAYGLAIDVNPFHNPYVRGRLVLPELASAYLDRGRSRPGMITASSPVVHAFAAVGWEWGGSWRSPKDYMHFSLTGN